MIPATCEWAAVCFLTSIGFVEKMTLKIEKRSEGATTIFRVSGRIGSENLEDLKLEIDGNTMRTALDLEHVTLVDVNGVRFLNACETRGIELIRCSPYIREWMAREREH